MGNNQFLSIGAIALLALISLRFNTTLLENRTTEIENKVYLTAFSLADDLIEEIKQKAFDEETVEWKAIPADQLSPYSLFGPVDPGESNVNTFDDIDDYHGYQKAVSLPHVENYSVMSTVDYVSASDPDVTSSSQTYFKRISVKVTSPYISHPVRLSFIFTLHSK
ncbi:MAG: hypothetical protein OEM46_08250 [Ignavibacteria bacterium]|nr:hypothetical protein [Ignavibacteria bacterium]